MDNKIIESTIIEAKVEQDNLINLPARSLEKTIKELSERNMKELKRRFGL